MCTLFCQLCHNLLITLRGPPGRPGFQAKTDFSIMFDAFLRLFLIWFLKRLFHIQIALGLFFKTNPPFNFLIQFSLQKSTFLWHVLGLFETAYCAWWEDLAEEGVVAVVFTDMWHLTQNIWHVTCDFLNSGLLFATFHKFLQLLITFFYFLLL